LDPRLCQLALILKPGRLVQLELGVLPGLAAEPQLELRAPQQQVPVLPQGKLGRRLESGPQEPVQEVQEALRRQELEQQARRAQRELELEQGSREQLAQQARPQQVDRSQQALLQLAQPLPEQQLLEKREPQVQALRFRLRRQCQEQRQQRPSHLPEPLFP